MTTLELLGQGVLLASLGLPLLWLLARAEGTEPASRHRRLAWALFASNALLVAPMLWARIPNVGGRPAEVFHGMVTAATLSPSTPSLSALSLLALGWLAASALALFRVVFDAWRLRRAIAEATLADEVDRARARRLALELSLPEPTLLESPSISTPCAASAWKPAILLPRGLRARLSDEAFDCVLRHELQHLHRRDQTWAVLVALLRVPFALHPVTKHLVADISLAREEAVDALVSRGDAHGYASALLEVAAQATTTSGFPNAVFMGAHALRKRVDMLINPRSLRPARSIPLLVASLSLGALAMVASPSPSEDPLSFTADLVPYSPLAPLSVKVGQQTLLTIPGVTHSEIADPTLAESCVLGDGKMHVSGLNWGTTTMKVWTTQGTFTYALQVE